MNAIPLAHARLLARAAARTAVVRAALAVALVALVAACAVVARHPQVRQRTQPYVPAGSAGIVVLDLSASISSDTFSRIGQTLRSLVARGGRYGLVVYSDQAYEALPPGTPASALRPLVRYFTLPAQTAPGIAPTFPANPWAQSFTAGTQISTGLELALWIVLRDHVRHPAVVLVSDLADDPQDVQRLTSVLLVYRRERIPLRIVGLNPAPSDAAYFQQLLGTATQVLPARLPGEPGYVPPAASAGVPVWLVAGAAAVAALLALHTLWSSRLRWGREAVA